MVVNILCKISGFWEVILFKFLINMRVEKRVKCICKECLFYFHPLIRGRITLKLLKKFRCYFECEKIIPLSLLTSKFCKLHQPVFISKQSPICFLTPFRAIFLCSCESTCDSKGCNCHEMSVIHYIFILLSFGFNYECPASHWIITLSQLCSSNHSGVREKILA